MKWEHLMGLMHVDVTMCQLPQHLDERSHILHVKLITFVKIYD